MSEVAKFVKQQLGGSDVATIFDDDHVTVEVMKRTDGRFELTVHNRRGESDRWDDCSAVMKPAHFAVLGTVGTTPPPEPPLPWLAIDLEAMQRGVEWLRYCAGAEGADSIALACHNVTLTAQLAEARGLLAKCGIVLNDAPQPARNEVATLKALLRLTALRWVPGITHEQIDAHIDAALAGNAAAIEGHASRDVVRVKWVDVTAGDIQEHVLYFGNAQVGCIRRLLYDQWRAYAGKREFGKFEGEYAAKAALLATLNGGE